MDSKYEKYYKPDPIWILKRKRKKKKDLMTEYETSFIENPHASETSPMILPVNNHDNRANGVYAPGVKTRANMAAKMRMRQNSTKNPAASKYDPPSPEDPWVPQKPIFSINDDEDFKQKVKYVNRYVSKLSSFMCKMEKEKAIEDEWRIFARIINRFFMVMTVVGFSLTALLFYLFASPRE